MPEKFVDDSSIMSVNSPDVSSPNVSSPKVSSPNVSGPNTNTPSGSKMVDDILDSIGLKVTKEGTA